MSTDVLDALNQAIARIDREDRAKGYEPKTPAVPAARLRLTLESEGIQTPQDDPPHWPGLALENLIARLRIFEATAELDALRVFADFALYGAWMGPRKRPGLKREKGGA